MSSINEELLEVLNSVNSLTDPTDAYAEINDRLEMFE